MSTRPANEIVDTIKANMVKRMELNDLINSAREQVHALEAQLLQLDNQQRLLETNLKRALIQEIEAEAAQDGRT